MGRGFQDCTKRKILSTCPALASTFLARLQTVCTVLKVSQLCSLIILTGLLITGSLITSNRKFDHRTFEYLESRWASKRTEKKAQAIKSPIASWNTLRTRGFMAMEEGDFTIATTRPIPPLPFILKICNF